MMETVFLVFDLNGCHTAKF